MFKFHRLFGAVMTQSLILAIIFSFSYKTPAQERISPDQLIEKHLASVGPPEARANFKSMSAVGVANVVFKGRGSGVTQGNVVIASEGKKNLLAMKFENADYPMEMAAFDGKEFSVSSLTPGTRSVLGDFLRVNQSTFKSSILGGVLATSWELYDYSAKSGKLTFSGSKTVEGSKLLEFRYDPKGGSDLNISLFFDAETYRHVRTEYSRIITSGQGRGVDSSARQSETRYKMIESFSGFGVENRLNLPHDYKLSLEILTGNGTTSYEWSMKFQNFTFNEPMDPVAFRVGPK